MCLGSTMGIGIMCPVRACVRARVKHAQKEMRRKRYKEEVVRGGNGISLQKKLFGVRGGENWCGVAVAKDQRGHVAVAVVAIKQKQGEQFQFH